MRKDPLGVLPGMLRGLPSQAIECCLWGVEDRAVGMARVRFRELVETERGTCGLWPS